MEKKSISLCICLFLSSLLPYVAFSYSIESQIQIQKDINKSLQCNKCSNSNKIVLNNTTELQYYGYYYVDDWDWHHQQEIENGDGKWARVTSLEPGTPNGGWDDDIYTISQFTNLIQVHWRSKPGFIEELANTDELNICLQLDYRCRKTAFGDCSELEEFSWDETKAGSIDWARYQLEKFLTWFDPNQERANRFAALYIADEPSSQGIQLEFLDRWANNVKTAANEIYGGHEFKTMVVFSSSYDYNPINFGSLGSGSGPYYYNDYVPDSIDIITIEAFPELMGPISDYRMSKLEENEEKIDYLDQLIRYISHITYGWAEKVARGRSIILQGQAYDERYWWDAEKYAWEVYEKSGEFEPSFPASQMLYATNYWTYYNIASSNSVGAVFHLPNREYNVNTIGLLWFYYPLSREEVYLEDPKSDIWDAHTQIGTQILFNNVSIISPLYMTYNTNMIPIYAMDSIKDHNVTWWRLWNGSWSENRTLAWNEVELRWEHENLIWKDGNYLLQVFLNDSAGNEVGSSRWFRIDTIAPVSIKDLRVSSTTTKSLTLNWTAPGDDELKGISKGYVIKYSTSSPISEDTWDKAKIYSQKWTPKRGNSLETHIISGLISGTQYWFAIKAFDDVQNSGMISNSPSGTTKSPTPPPPVDTDRDGLSDNEEMNIFGTDPLVPDSDGDGLTDGDEIIIYGTNPLMTDTDGDGLSDG